MNRITLVTLLMLFLSCSINVKAQTCFQNLYDFTGVNVANYQSEVESIACELIAEFPPEFQNQFKVLDVGFYLLSDAQSNNIQQVWQEAMTAASQQSPYYLLIGRALSYNTAYSEIYIDLKLPTTGVFSCVNENYFNVIKNTLSSPLVHGKEWGNHVSNSISGIRNLKAHITKISSCCADNGALEDCGCPINLNEARALLESYGYSALIGTPKVNPKSYSQINSDYEITLDYSDETIPITEVLESLATDYDVQCRVAYYDENNCADLFSFESLVYNSSSYYEDIVVLNFGDTPTVLSKVIFDSEELAKHKAIALNNKSQVLPWIVAQIIRRALLASAGVIVDFGMQMGVEKLVGGHQDWKATWDKIDIDEGGLLASALTGAFSEKKYVEFAADVLSPVVSYMLKTSPRNWSWGEIGKSFGVGLIQGMLGKFAGPFFKSFKRSVKNNNIVATSQVEDCVGELFPIIVSIPRLVPKMRGMVKAWKVIGGHPLIRKDIATLESAGKILDNAGISSVISSADLKTTVEKLAKKGVRCQTCSSGNPAYRYMDEILDDLEYGASKFGDNYSSVVTGFKQGGNFAEGAMFVSKAVKKYADEFPPKSIFEFTTKTTADNVRRVDVKVPKGFNGKDVFFEFKSVKEVPPLGFATQFVKDLDLPEVDDLNQLKWWFDKDKVSSLPKQKFIDALENASISQDILNKLIKVGPKKKEALVDLIDDQFDIIFSVK